MWWGASNVCGRTDWSTNRNSVNSTLARLPVDMKPRRTEISNQVFSLPGGTEDNDLWLHNDGERLISCWQLTDEERSAIADGALIELVVWGQGAPPVTIRTCNHKVGASA
jgi:hypothetical protein